MERLSGIPKINQQGIEFRVNNAVEVEDDVVVVKKNILECNVPVACEWKVVEAEEETVMEWNACAARDVECLGGRGGCDGVVVCSCCMWVECGGGEVLCTWWNLW